MTAVTKETAPAQAMVRADGIVKNYGKLSVLDGMDLEVEAGEVVCLIGPSG